MAQNKENLTWNKVLNAVLELPGVKVDRVAFLRKELKAYCSASKLDLLESVRPYTIVSDGVIDTVARKCINRHTTLATTASTIAGLPGGLAMAAAIPGDITQYYYHVVVLSQKLAYLYGFPDFCDEEGELTDQASDLLTIFMGSMMGVKVADQGITELAKGMAQQAVGRLPRVAITKAAVVPIAASIARVAGLKLSKEGLAKGVGKFIPIAGGLFSGSLTLFTFRPGAHRLRKRLKAQKSHFTDGDIAFYIEQKVAHADLDDEEKLELLGNVGTEESREGDFSYDVDFDVLACDPDYAEDCLRSLIAVAHAQNTQPTAAERMFLTMSAKALGLSKDVLDEWLEQSF